VRRNISLIVLVALVGSLFVVLAIEARQERTNRCQLLFEIARSAHDSLSIVRSDEPCLQLLSHSPARSEER